MKLVHLFLSVALLAIRAMAAPVAIGDFSFEGNSIAAGQWTNDLSPEWQETNGPNNGSGFEEYIPGFVAAGTDHLGMESGHDVWQDLTVTYQANTRYTLTVAAGNRSGSTQGGNQSQYALTNTAGVAYASGSFDASTIAAQTFADAPVLVFETPANPAAIGQTIRIRLQARGSGRSHFDNIRLDAEPVSVPGSATVGGLAASNLSAGTATLNGTVTEIGDGAPAITVFWGPSNGNANPGGWANSMDLPGTYSGGFSADIAGLNPATNYYFTARATNSAGVSWALPAASFETLATPPSVVTGGASSIGATTANLGANVTATGGEDPAVTIYFGTTDGGADAGAWARSASAGVGSGALAAQVAGLAPATGYFFRAYATNSGGGAWAPASASFSTLAVTVPVVENRTPEGITGTTANLRGEITATGNDVPVVTLFYGTADGGTDPGGWATSVNHGLQAGEFTRFVAGLSPNTLYHFRWRAVNAAGAAWSSESGTFTTTALVPSGVVINEFHYNPLDNTSLEEFIELHNPGDTVIDLSGWTLSDAVTYTFPPGTTIPVGAYRVIAENPATVQSKFGVSGVLGPWTGKLSSDGERIDLRDAAGVLVDRVSYGSGFPWPTSPDGAGPSCELINTSLDNDLGGSWRASIAPGVAAQTFISPSTANWRYLKGTAEASSPVEAWRDIAFNDAGWLVGTTPIGMGTSIANTTVLSDMLSGSTLNYRTVYARKAFTVAAGSIPDNLTLKVRIDDGCVVWINNTEVYRVRVNSGQLPYNSNATNGVGTAAWATINLTGAQAYLKGGSNVLAIHAVNRDSFSNRGDFSFDVELTAPATGGGSAPSPGKVNGVARNANLVPPQIRQVAHTPNLPLPNQPVAVTARITDPDGMGAVSLAYQVVNPGSYIRITDAAYATSWTTVAMFDNGTNGDAVAGDSTFTAVLPAALQTNRRLVRYRITFADALGNSQTVPYADDEQPNFAYFVYAGVPSWTGAMRPSAYNGFPATPPQTYPASMLESMPPFHLIANASDVSASQGGNTSRYHGAVISRGVVHDHIQFRVRGIGSTTVSGKNKWNIYFNRSRDYQAYDNYGRPYRETWNNLLVNCNASPWASVHRGSAGVEEAVSNKIYQIAGMAAMDTHYFHFRVIDDAAETGATQYDGDLWGLYLGVEPSEGNFLDERGLADGNVYSIEGNAGDKKHQGPTQPLDSSDWSSFSTALAASGQTEQWYRDNIDLAALYTFLAINRLIGNVDVRPGDNYRFYHRPTDNRWVIFPYDMDMQFIAAHHWGGSMDGVVVAGAPNVIRAISRHPNLAREYRNRCREILSLMGSDGAPTGGQIGQLIDEYARFVNPAGEPLTWADLDAAMWNLNPKTTGSGANSGQSSHKGNFFRAYYLDGGRGGLGGTTSTGSWIRSLPDPDADGFSDHEGMMQWFVRFATNTWPGGTWNRKAMTGIGSGTDSDPNRQLGFGYKYLEFESLYGGWIDCNSNPGAQPNNDYPAKPTASYAGGGGFPVDQLSFTSSAFSDPQGAGTYASHEWRVAEISAPGIASYVPGTPRKYEIQTIWSSGELTGAPDQFTIPLGVTEPGRTYRVRVRHKDSAGNWSYWSDPVEFGATPAPPGVLIHYWNFNETAALLAPTQTIGGGSLAVAATLPATFEAGSGQDFAGLNARNDDFAETHLRVNYPLTFGTAVTAAIPTTGFENIIVKYETRRSGQGAGTQTVAYTLDGTTYATVATFAILDDVPVVKTLDFRGVAGAGNNPFFGIRITFAQGSGGTAGNNRFDNLTVEADALPGQPEFLPGGDGDWNIASNWASASIPDGNGALAIIHEPATADRAVNLTAPVTVGTLAIDNGAGSFRNRLTGIAGVALTFHGGATAALLDTAGTGTGLIEFDVPGGINLATDLRLVVPNLVGDPVHGALRLRGVWDGPGGLVKQGLGIASLTGEGKSVTGPVVVEQGVLQVTQPAAPGQTSGITVQSGGQLRLTSGNDLNGPRSYTFGGAMVLAGSGRGPEIPILESNGVSGALRYAPDVAGSNRAIVTTPLTLAAASEIHIVGADNTLELGGTLSGSTELTKSGDGSLVLGGSSPAFSGVLAVAGGALEVNGSLANASVQLAPGTRLQGAGTTGPLGGGGTVAPQLTTLTASASSAADYDFVLAYTGHAGNSMLRLTEAAAFGVSPATVDLFIDRATRLPGDRLAGGLVTAPTFDLSAALAGTQVRLLVPDPAGTVVHQGASYREALPADGLTWSVVDQVIDPGTGPVVAKMIEVLVGGEPVLYAQWRNLHFANPADAANDAVSGPGANPSGDGVSNLMRYALGVGPFEPVTGLMPVLAEGPASVFTFRFRYDPAKSDLAWVVRATNDLGDWSHPLFDSRVGSIPPLEDGWLPVPLPSSLNGGPVVDPRMFVRLEVIQAAP